MSPFDEAASASPFSVVAPESGLGGAENAPAPRNADTIWPPASHVAPALPASSTASVGSVEATARFEVLVNALHVPVANGALRSENATYGIAPVSRWSQIAVTRPPGVIWSPMLQSVSPVSDPRVSNGWNAAAPAALTALSTWKSPAPLVRRV